MVAAKSARNYACPFPKKKNKKQKQKPNNVIVNFLRNNNLPSSLMLSNSSPFLAWHDIFPYLATSLSMLDHYERDSPTHLILITVFFIYIRPEGNIPKIFSFNCESSLRNMSYVNFTSKI